MYGFSKSLCADIDTEEEKPFKEAARPVLVKLAIMAERGDFLEATTYEQEV